MTTDTRVRDFHGTVEALRRLRDEYQAGLPTTGGVCDWTPEQGHAYRMKNVCDGLLFSLTSARTSFAAETLLYEWPSLVDLVHTIHGRLEAQGSNFAVGFPGPELCDMARELYYLMLFTTGRSPFS